MPVRQTQGGFSLIVHKGVSWNLNSTNLDEIHQNLNAFHSSLSKLIKFHLKSYKNVPFELY
jgi:hypothetical protein